jgi:Ser/Thr protein kinase RdoA (MazF antagonist)
LRLTPALRRDRAELNGELDFIFHLARHHVPVAVPMHSESGLMVEELVVSGEPYYAVVFGELPGKQIRISGKGAAVVRAWGGSLGRLHAASRGFVPAPTSTIRSWEDNLRQAETWLPAEEAAARGDLGELGARLRGLPAWVSGIISLHPAGWVDG